MKTSFQAEEERMNQTPSINIYRIIIQNADLPEGDDEKVRVLRDYASQVTGLEAPNIWIESDASQAHCQLTVSIPDDLEDAVRSMREAGLQPEFSEPAQPVLQDGSCLLPLSFQVRHFGRPLEPGMLDNDPNRQVMIAGAMSRQVDDLPEAAPERAQLDLRRA